MRYESIILQISSGIAKLTLNRPADRNAVTQSMMGEIQHALNEIENDDLVRVLVLDGTGPSFSSGFDIKEQIASRPEGVEVWDRILRNDLETVTKFWRFKKPTIAAVHGACFGGAFQLAIACDITIASDDAVFAEPELLFGSTVAVMLLPWLVPPKIAKEIILTGEDALSAAYAQQIGLVNKVVPASDLQGVAMKMARRIATMDPLLVQATKRAINLAYESPTMATALNRAIEENIAIEGSGSPDKKQFLEIARASGLKAAFAWRASRFSGLES